MYKRVGNKLDLVQRMMQVQPDKAIILIPFVGGFVTEIVVVIEVLYWHQGDQSENSWRFTV